MDDEAHLMVAFRYVAMNPVKANLVQRPAGGLWSSSPAHLADRNDVSVDVRPLLARVDDVAQFLSDEAGPGLEQALGTGQSIGRPLMDDARFACCAGLQQNLYPDRQAHGKHGEAMQSLIEERIKELEGLARRHGVSRLDVFGSAANGSFDEAHSDIDFIVDFVDQPPGGIANAYFGLLEDLQQLFDRKVDLITERSISNPYFRASIEENRRPVYVA